MLFLLHPHISYLKLDFGIFHPFILQKKSQCLYIKNVKMNFDSFVKSQFDFNVPFILKMFISLSLLSTYSSPAMFAF